VAHRYLRLLSVSVRVETVASIVKGSLLEKYGDPVKTKQCSGMPCPYAF
jgi:hypothetical protein